jgi:membrane protease YdiL (CAAX protease family)
MTDDNSLLRRHPVLTYYVLTFAISWGAVLAVILARGIPARQDEANAILPVAILAMLCGPLLAAVISAGLVGGRTGVRGLFARLRNWTAGARWHAFAVLVGPAVLVAVPFLLAALNPAHFPAGEIMSGVTAQTIAMGILSGLLVGLCEELGWTGFVNPRLRKRYGVLGTGLLMGILWGAWHIMANGVLGMRINAGNLSPSVFLAARSFAFMLGWLPAFRVLMVWVYDHTGSLPLLVLMHAGATAASIIFAPLVYGTDYVLFDAALGAAMWIIAAIVATTNRGHLEAGRAATSSP